MFKSNVYKLTPQWRTSHIGLESNEADWEKGGNASFEGNQVVYL